MILSTTLPMCRQFGGTSTWTFDVRGLGVLQDREVLVSSAISALAAPATGRAGVFMSQPGLPSREARRFSTHS